jgi:UrcA family protein
MKIALAAALLASPQVCAFQAPNGETVRVSYADLDLRYERDQQWLAARVENAVERVCGVDPHERQIVVRQAAQQCVAQTTPAADAAFQAVLENAA